MPLIESISLTNQAINIAKTITFAAAPANYEQVQLRVWLYDLAAVSAAKTASCYITRGGSGILSRFIINPTITTAFASICLTSDLFILGAGDILRTDITGSSSDTANVDIVAEIWGIPDLSALITTVDTVVDAIKVKTDNLPTDPADQSLLMAEIQTRATPADVQTSVAVTAANAATLALGNIAFISYAHNSVQITSTSTEDLSSATKVWFALKDSYSETDAQSLIFIEKTLGLTHVGKSAIVLPIVAGDGSLTVGGSSGAWTFTVMLKSEAAALLADYVGSGKLGEVKATIGGNDIVIGTVTGAINSGVIRTNA